NIGLSIKDGYRHIPVLQIGSDIFVNSALIIEELDNKNIDTDIISQNLLEALIVTEIE
ncbi:4607_t:CDS:1, partial [Funneliformis geosporum]